MKKAGNWGQCVIVMSAWLTDSSCSCPRWSGDSLGESPGLKMWGGQQAEL